jgi:hypothetical protein
MIFLLLDGTKIQNDSKRRNIQGKENSSTRLAKIIIAKTRENKKMRKIMTKVCRLLLAF